MTTSVSRRLNVLCIKLKIFDKNAPNPDICIG